MSSRSQGRRGTARRAGRRADRRGGPLLMTLLLIALLLGSVLTVVLILDHWDSSPSPATGCRISDGERTYSLSADQLGHAALIAGAGSRRDLPPQAIRIAIATAMQESSLHNLDYGDRDSLGLFQQRPSQGWGSAEEVMDPSYAVGVFFDRLLDVPDYAQRPLTEAAQAVQRSAYPDLYAQHEGLATAVTDALTGATHGSLWCHLPEAASADSADSADSVSRDTAASGEHPADYPRLGELLQRDHPEAEVASISGSQVEVRVQENSWELAHWAVATAADSGIREVTVESSQWDGGEDGWQPAPDEMAEGLVTMR